MSDNPSHSIIVHGGATQNALRAQELEKENAQLRAQIVLKDGQLKFAIADSCDDETRIRDLARPFLTPEQIDGDSYSVPGVVEVVEALKAQLEQAQAACAEMRKCVQHIFNWKCDLLPKHGNLILDCERALSTTCGRGWFSSEQLKPTIELLTRFQQLQGKSLAHWPDLPRELTRLKALVEEADK